MQKIVILIIGAIYHPPDGKDSVMIAHISVCLEKIIQKSSEAGIFIMGDFNKLWYQPLQRNFKIKQFMRTPTRSTNILDKIMTNPADYYA
jgi:hypothetical protein